MDKPKGRNDGHKLDYSNITSQIIVGSDLCKGNVCPVHSDEFNKLDVCAEINLSIERKETPPESIDSYTWMPVVDGYPPNKEQLMLGTTIINEVVEKGKRIYVHCKNGHGRSPTLIAAYLIRFKGKKVAEAVEQIKKVRPEIHIEDTQLEALKEFEKAVQKTS